MSDFVRRHPDAGVYLSQPGIGASPEPGSSASSATRPGRYATAEARRNYAGALSLTTESGKKRTVHARRARNRHLIDALHAQASPR